MKALEKLIKSLVLEKYPIFKDFAIREDKHLTPHRYVILLMVEEPEKVESTRFIRKVREYIFDLAKSMDLLVGDVKVKKYGG